MADETRPTISRLTGQTISYGKFGNAPEFDGLRLPNNKTIAESSDHEIRQICARLGIENAWTAGRAVIVAKYSERISDIFNTAGAAAVERYLDGLK